MTDLDDRPRIFHAMVDRGACEFIPVISGDLDQNAAVDLDELTALVGCTGGAEVTTPPPGSDPGQFQRADLDGDAGLADFALLLAHLAEAER